MSKLIIEYRGDVLMNISNANVQSFAIELDEESTLELSKPLSDSDDSE